MAAKTFLKTTLKICAVLFLLAQPTFAALPRYEVIDLGTLGGRYSSARAINDAGQVVGWSYTADGFTHAFFWDPINGMIDLGTLPGKEYSYAAALNEFGIVVGTSGGSDEGWAFVWDPINGMRYLNGLRDSEGGARGINNSGKVVGNVWLNDCRAFIWDSYIGVTDLGTLGGRQSSAPAINNVCQVVGDSEIPGGDWHAFLWKDGVMTDLGTLGGADSRAYAINDLGQVVGWSTTESGDWNAFFWDTKKGMIDIGPGWAWDINNAGQVVGWLNPTTVGGPAFYWDSYNGMVIFDCLTRGCDINNRGQIVGEGITDRGESHAFLMTPIPPKTIYVDADAAGANDGSSWADAFNFLQDALADANFSPKPVEIRVAEGIYKPDQGAGITPGDREATFQLINGVTLKGGYAGFGQPDPNARDINAYKTILSGDLNGDDVVVVNPKHLLDEPTRADNSYHVVTASGTDATAVLDGFNIIAGNANGHWETTNDKGGGIFNSGGNPQIANCILNGNSAIFCGGGLYDYAGSPILSECAFSNNSAGTGGGMFNGDYSNPPVANCTFSANWAAAYGAGIWGGAGPITNCMFTGNSTAGGGGGLSSCDGPITNCRFVGNSADWCGGAIANWNNYGKVTNCIFSGNSARYCGGAIHNDDSSPTLVNCTFIGNMAGNWGGAMYNTTAEDGSYATLINCITWGPANQIYDAGGSATTIKYSNIKNAWPGEGNIDADPCFVALGYWEPNGTPEDANDDYWVEGDYHLLPDSPCIDTGDPNYPYDPNETDLDGRPRVIGGRIDMGAYEAPIFAEAEIEPDTLNLQSKGKWITAFIQLPEEYNVTDIDPNSVLLEGRIKPARFWLTEDNQIAIAKFSREQVQSILEVGDINLTITGQLTDGTVFEGTDTIKVIDKGDKK